MTREEIIARANQAVTDAFEAGAEWEHKRLIEKVSKWIKENTDWTEEYIWDGRNPNYGLWSELKKAMEG